MEVGFCGGIVDRMCVPSMLMLYTDKTAAICSAYAENFVFVKKRKYAPRAENQQPTIN